MSTAETLCERQNLPDQDPSLRYVGGQRYHAKPIVASKRLDRNNTVVIKVRIDGTMAGIWNGEAVIDEAAINKAEYDAFRKVKLV